MNIRLKLILFISFLFIAAIANSLLTFQLEGYSNEKLKWVNHTHEVIIISDDFMGAIKDTETGQRGYLLTNNLNYLEPYYSGLLTAQKQFIKLKSLTSDNPTQQERLDLVEKSMKLKFEELKETIELTEKKKNVEAIEIVKKNTGKKYMDDIRIHIDKFINTEMLLLEKRKGDFRAHRAKITTIIAIEVMFFLFLAFMTISF